MLQGAIRKMTAVMLVVTVGVLPLAACTTASQPQPTKQAARRPVSGGVIRFPLSGDPVSIDPYNAQESLGIQVSQAVFDSLTAVDPNSGRLEPAAAESWSANKEATVWTFRLRSGAKFHDGTPVTAKDFVYAWNRMATSAKKNPKNPSQVSFHLEAIKGFAESTEQGKPLEGLRAVDEDTLEVDLAYPFADFDYVVSHPALAPVPSGKAEGVVEFEGKNVPFSDMPIGNGPFKMAAPWKHDEMIELVRNDKYPGRAPYVKGIRFPIYRDDEGAYRDFQAGDVDFASIPVNQVKTAKKAYGVSDDGYTVQPGKGVLTGQEVAIFFLAVNGTDKLGKNQKVREAVSYAINRQAIADTVYEGTKRPATSISTPRIPGHEESAFRAARYDVELAKRLLDEAGYPGGKGMPPLVLEYASSYPDQGKAFEIVQADLKKVGVTAKIKASEGAVYQERLFGKKYQFGGLVWVADYPILDTFLYPLFQSQGQVNIVGYNNPEVDRTLEEARSTIDAKERTSKYAEIERTVGSSTPLIPLLYEGHRQVGSKRLNDFVYDNQGLAHFERAWLTDGGSDK